MTKRTEYACVSAHPDEHDAKLRRPGDPLPNWAIEISHPHVNRVLLHGTLDDLSAVRDNISDLISAARQLTRQGLREGTFWATEAGTNYVYQVPNGAAEDDWLRLPDVSVAARQVAKPHDTDDGCFVYQMDEHVPMVLGRDPLARDLRPGQVFYGDAGDDLRRVTVDQVVMVHGMRAGDRYVEVHVQGVPDKTPFAADQVMHPYTVVLVDWKDGDLRAVQVQYGHGHPAETLPSGEGVYVHETEATDVMDACEAARRWFKPHD